MVGGASFGRTSVEGHAWLAVRSRSLLRRLVSAAVITCREVDHNARILFWMDSSFMAFAKSARICRAFPVVATANRSDPTGFDSRKFDLQPVSAPPGLV